MISHKVMISFEASRPLTADEMSSLEAAIAAQVEEPQVYSEDDYQDAEYSTSNVLVSFIVKEIH